MRRFAFFLLSTFFAAQLFAQDISSLAQYLSQDIENSVAKGYLETANSKYTNTIGRTGTSVMNYHNGYDFLNQLTQTTDGRPGWGEQPAAVQVPSAGGKTIKIADNYQFTNSISYTASGAITPIYNLIPDRVYWYQVLNSAGMIVDSGVLKTQGALRMIKTGDILNVRDIGGWPCSGGHIAYGKLIRGGTLNGESIYQFSKQTVTLTATDKKILTEQVGIKAELDLNTSRTSSLLGSGITFNKYTMSHYMYLMTNTSYSSTTVKTANWHSTLASILKQFSTNLKNNKCSYIHCQWGTDRTGSTVAIIQAICGMSEADIVKDWELSSLSSAFYFKFIDHEELDYYYNNSSGKPVKSQAELRSMLTYLYDNYGGSSGKSIQEQVISWLKTKVFASESDKGESIITTIQQYLVTPDTQSPVIVRDWSREAGIYRYTVTTDKNVVYSSSYNSRLSNKGAMVYDNSFCYTGYIACSGQKTLWVNAHSNVIAVFYDANKKVISSATDASVAEDAVVLGDKAISVPTNAKYVRLNMPKNCSWSSVLYN